MNDETRIAFENVIRSKDGDIIYDYFKGKVAELSDVRNATPENFVSRGMAATFIENEILAKFRIMEKKVEDNVEGYI